MTQSALKRDPAALRTPNLYGHPRSYGQFALFLGKESPYIFSKFNSLNMDTPLVNTDTFYAPLPPPSVSVLTGFDCLDFQDLAGGRRGMGTQQSCPLTFEFVPTGLSDF